MTGPAIGEAAVRAGARVAAAPRSEIRAAPGKAGSSRGSGGPAEGLLPRVRRAVVRNPCGSRAAGSRPSRFHGPSMPAAGACVRRAAREPGNLPGRTGATGRVRGGGLGR